MSHSVGEATAMRLFGLVEETERLKRTLSKDTTCQGLNLGPYSLKSSTLTTRATETIRPSCRLNILW